MIYLLLTIMWIMTCYGTCLILTITIIVVIIIIIIIIITIIIKISMILENLTKKLDL